MDLMRTLLIYMSATMALAVQNTTAPKETPVPTPAPNAVVETVKAPALGEGFTPAPVPTITPNMKGYHNLTMGAKGKDVRKLQEKLIEMGYLPEGSADGAYGRKTFNAVKKFQYYNGLTADGIAGRKTQTNLFENPEVVPNPEVTAAPEETPAPSTAAPEAPEVMDTPAPDTSETEEGAADTAAPEEETPADGETTAAEETEAPAAETETPAAKEAETEEPAEAEKAEETEIVENLDLDADVYEQITASIALNEGNGPLEYVVTEDGVPSKRKPRVRYNGEKIRVSLDDLCASVEKWQLTDDKAGTVVVEAAGYTLVLYNEDKGYSATLDGAEIPLGEDDFDFSSDGHFINAEFLAKALKGTAAWDQEESTLMLRIPDKDAVATED